MKTALSATLTVLGAIAVSLAGLWLVRALWPAAAQVGSNEIGDDFITVLGTAYGVLIAFMVSAVWNRYTSADQDADTEANHILALVNLARLLDYAAGPSFIRSVLSYGHSVVEDEWPLLARGEGSDHSLALLSDLWESFRSLAAESGERDFVLSQALARLEDLSDCRRVRLFNCDDSIPSVLWILLLFEGAVTVAFTYLLVAPTMLLQVLMTVALTATIAASLYVVRLLDHPFRGSVHISCDNLHVQLVQWEHLHSAILLRSGGEAQLQVEPNAFPLA